MMQRTRSVLLGALIVLCFTAPFGRSLSKPFGWSGTGGAITQPTELRSTMPTATLAGSTLFTYWGVAIYNASLWVAPGFKPDAYERHAFALELTYLRDFSNADITRRSIDEMRRLGAGAAQLQTWQTLLHQAFPDVRKGDRITGLHQPGAATIFMTNGQKTGAMADPDFGRLFFGIWLSVQTSEPRMRQALLAQTAP